MLIDTHCHIHESNYPLDVAQTLKKAKDADVGAMICVGTSEASSREAVAFVAKHPGTYASIGVHPHETKEGYGALAELAANKDAKLVAIGEIGLDYFYTHSPRGVQIEALQSQIQLAIDHQLPVIFHARQAFDDFWPIFDNFHGIRGVLHSFTDTQANMEEGLKRGLYIGVNGISTFTKDAAQRKMFAALPLERMVLETDAPFLTPLPFRGKVNEPAFVCNVAEYHAGIRSLPVDEIASITTANARALFAL